ncbi:MAG: M23 family metallopeptidase [Candidatus Marinarcus sp.]|uniref:M23 family metallopeptidase n=1 Tax=Candidatus Marinarcus sp. TaxID=3100987 RepID=UPI003AFFBA74
MRKSIQILIFITLFNLLSYAKDVELFLENNHVNSGSTALLYLNSSHVLKNPKLTFEKLNIDFAPHPTLPNGYFAFIPVDYYTPLGSYTVIVSYKENGKKRFKAVTLNVTDAHYSSEVINVAKSKVELNKKDKERTKKEYEEAMRLYHYISSKKFTTSSFINPLNTPITSQFGTKRVYNNTIKSYHSGTDYKAPIGTKIYATASGVVKMAQNRFYAGNSVVIDHGYGVYSGYYHLSKLLVKKNQHVKQGQLIGISGDTGRVTGPHLHFSFRVHGIQVNPLEFLEVANKLQ